MGARAQVAWMIRGRSATLAGLESLSVDLRELQQKVAGLETILYDLRRDHLRLGERQLDEFDSVRAAVAKATDDLVARVDAVDERVRGSA